MMVSLKTKLSAGVVGVTVLGMLIAAFMVDRNVGRSTLSGFEDRLSYQTTMLGQMTASALFGEIDPSDTSLREPVRALGESVHTRLTVMAKDGTVIADSVLPPDAPLGTAAGAPELLGAKEAGKGVAQRDERLLVALPIVRDGSVLGFAESSVPMAEVNAQLHAVRFRMGLGILAALVVAVALGLGLSSALVRPIRALADGARRVEQGDFSRAIEVRSRDEIGGLARAFNDMTASLKRTIELLDGRNRDMRLVLDNVDQGLLTLDRTGAIVGERSAVVTKWFGAVEDGSSFAACLGRVSPATELLFQLQWEELIEGALPRRVLLHQMPRQVQAGEKTYSLSYIPITDGDGAIEKVLVVVSDITARLAAERAEADQREIAAMFEHIMRDRAGVLDFLVDAKNLVAQCTGAARPALTDVKRAIHTLKGNSGSFGLRSLAGMCHEIENRMEESQGDVSEADRKALAAAWAQTEQRLAAFLSEKDRGIEVLDHEYAQVLRALLDGSPRTEVVRLVADWKLERAGDRMDRLAHQARELARRLGKGDVEIAIEGAQLRLPRLEWSGLWSTFVHVVRNAIDHGLESPDERAAAGKKSRPRLRLSAAQVGGGIQVEISDDGRGIAWDRIADKARKRGLPASSQADLVAALFADGVSTKDEVSDVSGRGVGLGAAKEACERLGGHVTVESRLAFGTSFKFYVPLPPPRLSLVPRPTVLPEVASATAE